MNDRRAPKETRAEFVARALRAREEARRSGVYYDVDAVLEALRRRLTQARRDLQQREKRA